MLNTITKVKILLSHSVTYLITAQTVLTYLIAGGHLDDFPTMLRYATMAVAGIGAILIIVRQNAPVPSDQVKGIIEARNADVMTAPKV